MINKTLHTATMTDKQLTSESLTWAQATFTWNQGIGTWDNPYTILNKTLHTASLTNKTITP